MINDKGTQEKIKWIDLIESIYDQIQQKGEDWLITVNVEHLINYILLVKENPPVEMESYDSCEGYNSFLGIVNALKERYFKNLINALEDTKALVITLGDFLYTLIDALLVAIQNLPYLTNEKTRNQIYSFVIDNIDIQDSQEGSYEGIASRKSKHYQYLLHLDTFIKELLTPYKQDSIHKNTH